jgi:TIR domain-containing protein
MTNLTERNFALYFSHSWKPNDVDLNLRVWEAMRSQCDMLVDKPDETGPTPPPYYINRIEELLRRADLFASVLTHRQPRDGDFTTADATLQCSPYALFEVRLAERADIPRLILYERTTGFKPPRVQRPWEVYVAFDRGSNDRLPDQAQWTKVVESKIDQWLKWTTDHRRPASYEQSTQAAILVDRDTHRDLIAALEACLSDGGYDAVCCDVVGQRSSRILRQLREAGLVAAEFSAPSRRLEQLYAAAHGLGIPAVRLMFGGNKTELPWILAGDPGGYQLDIAGWMSVDEISALVKPRIASMFRLSPALHGSDAADYLQSKRYATFFVFLSHTLKPPHRDLVDKVFARLVERRVPGFEYHKVNAAGVDWRQAMKEALENTTHFIALLSDGYELSTANVELDRVLERKDVEHKDVTILPFMADGRSRPHHKLQDRLHHMLLPADSDQAANLIVERIMTSLDQSARPVENA